MNTMIIYVQMCILGLTTFTHIMKTFVVLETSAITFII